MINLSTYWEQRKWMLLSEELAFVLENVVVP